MKAYNLYFVAYGKYYVEPTYLNRKVHLKINYVNYVLLRKLYDIFYFIFYAGFLSFPFNPSVPIHALKRATTSSLLIAFLQF